MAVKKTNKNNNNQQLFKFGEYDLKTIGGEEPVFVAKDVCDILEIKDPSKAVEQIEKRLKEADIKDTISNRTLVQTAGGKQKMLTINEQGLYELVFASRKKQAVKFRAWVTSEVLPTLRKDGAYSINYKEVA
jgi:prophage antirepressor-like protein